MKPMSQEGQSQSEQSWTSAVSYDSQKTIIIAGQLRLFHVSILSSTNLDTFIKLLHFLKCDKLL